MKQKALPWGPPALPRTWRTLTCTLFAGGSAARCGLVLQEARPLPLGWALATRAQRPGEWAEREAAGPGMGRIFGSCEPFF